jgi:hypothetical protein
MISSGAEICPVCGHRHTRLIPVLIVVALAGGLLWMFTLYL